MGCRGGTFTSLAFSLVVFLELREEPLEMIDSQLKSAAAAVAGRKRGRKNVAGRTENPAASFFRKHYWIKVYDKDLRVVYHSEVSGR